MSYASLSKYWEVFNGVKPCKYLSSWWMSTLFMELIYTYFKTQIVQNLMWIRNIDVANIHLLQCHCSTKWHNATFGNQTCSEKKAALQISSFVIYEKDNMYLLPIKVILTKVVRKKYYQHHWHHHHYLSHGNFVHQLLTLRYCNVASLCGRDYNNA